MNKEIAATLITEGSRFISEFIRTRSHKVIKIEPNEGESEIAEKIETSPEQSSVTTPESADVATGCVPCAIGHLGTCSGLLNEAMRFAKKDGLSSSEVIDRMNMCLDELNAMERVDLRPELIAGLPEWEKTLANEALTASRATRHRLESIKITTDLEATAAETQTVRNSIGRTWFKNKLKNLSPEQKEEIHQKVMQKLEQVAEE